ncbi:MAG: hypothetical protein WCH93_04845 [Actinomycetota bacterium]
MSDTTGVHEPWPPPHPVIDAAYGPRFRPPVPPPVPEPGGRRAGWDLTPIEPTPRSSRWLVVFTAICVLFAALGGYLAYRFVSNDQNPTSWDPRVSTLAVFVERETGLSFTRPVRVRFLNDAEFNKLVTDEASSLSDTERREIADDEAIGRAFGWYTGTTDVVEQKNQLNSAGVLALYSFASREIVVRTDEPNAATLSAPIRATITHEMVHVIQDQHLNIRRLQSNAKGEEQARSVTALIEGHAVYVERRYIFSLPEAEQQAFFDYANKAGDEVEEATKDVAPAITTGLEAPYLTGPILVAAAALTKAGIEQLFVRPPLALDQVLDPRAYFSEDIPETIDAPTEPGKIVEKGTIGMVRLYLTLATAMSPQEAWEAAAGWGNDSYTAARADEKSPVCVSWNLVADSETAAKTLHSALSKWASTRVKQSAVTVDPSTSPTRVRFCDPGTAVAQTLVAETAVEYFYTRANVLEALIANSGSLDVAACATDVVMRTETVANLQEPDDALRDRVAAAVSACSKS